MTEHTSILEGLNILAVDDEEDILETIDDILDESHVDCARDYETASQWIQETKYDLAILDIMGVNGLELLEESVARGIPTVMLTAHAINPKTLMESIRKGAISYLPKEKLADLDELLSTLLDAHKKGIPPWKRLFKKLGSFFDERFGPDWKKKDEQFWSDFDRTYQVGRGIQKRLMQDEKIKDKGI
ncbi:MAG: response regulator [Desulfobacterales bacterium]|nr:response regulator [Desulfobacterales bacterium]